jgi:hypothetical protein
MSQKLITRVFPLFSDRMNMVLDITSQLQPIEDGWAVVPGTVTHTLFSNGPDSAMVLTAVIQKVGEPQVY